MERNKDSVDVSSSPRTRSSSAPIVLTRQRASSVEAIYARWQDSIDFVESYDCLLDLRPDKKHKGNLKAMKQSIIDRKIEEERIAKAELDKLSQPEEEEPLGPPFK